MTTSGAGSSPRAAAFLELADRAESSKRRLLDLAGFPGLLLADQCPAISATGKAVVTPGRSGGDRLGRCAARTPPERRLRRRVRVVEGGSG